MKEAFFRKGMVIAIIGCFIGAGVVPIISGDIVPPINKGNCIVIIDSENEAEILKQIEETVDKVLVVDEIIGDKQVKYWEHAIDYVFVKNDFILLHIDTETGVITNYERRWTDVELDLSNLGDMVFEPNNYFWKKAVVFPDEDDCTYFYTFNDPQEYPVVSLEVRHTDGTTIIYNFDGEQIGHGIPTPNKGFSLSGYNTASWPDPWIDYRTNADFWFSQWCDTTTSLSLPTPSTISSYVSDPNVMYFYELAHGDEFNFQAEAVGSSYTATMVHNDMAGRPPIRLAFIGSCHGMTSTGPGTFSYEFRKSQMTDTVTIGYDHMETCPGWQYAIPWQDSMFENMNKGLTMKASFDMATALYPTIAPAVVFLGDQNLIVPEEDSAPVWEFGDKWIYSLDPIVIEIDEDDFGLFVDLDIGDLTLEVVDVQSDSCEVDFHAKLNGGFRLSLKDSSFDITGDFINSYFTKSGLEGKMIFQKSDLGIIDMDMILSAKIKLIFSWIPMRIPIDIQLNIDYDNPVKSLDFPLYVGKVWTNLPNTITIDGQIRSSSFNFLKFLNQFFNFLPPEIADLLPVIDISEFFEAIGYENKFVLPGGVNAFECVSQEDITVPAGNFNAYKIIIQGGRGTLYYSPDVGIVSKLSVDLRDYLPFKYIINSELLETNYS